MTPLVIFTLFMYASLVSAEEGPLYLFGGAGHKEFLGCLNCGSIHPKSVWNEMSTFGFKNDFGIWNPFGQFANPFSPYSMCNQYSSEAPIIVDERGNAYGRMSLNEYTPGSVCSATGSERLCEAVRVLCQSKN